MLTRHIREFLQVTPGLTTLWSSSHECVHGRYTSWSPPPYVIFASTSRPPDVTHVINETRPSPFFALFRFRVLYWTQTKELKRGRPGNEATPNPRMWALCSCFVLLYLHFLVDLLLADQVMCEWGYMCEWCLQVWMRLVCTTITTITSIKGITPICAVFGSVIYKASGTPLCVHSTYAFLCVEQLCTLQNGFSGLCK